MSVNRLFYTIKLESDTIHENKYNLNLSFEQALKSGLVISLADSQMLKTIRKVTDHDINRGQLEEWFEERDRIKKKKNSKANRERINELQQCIYDMMYIPEYITVVMTNKKHYERMFKKGFKLNGEEYKRISCSASQARVSTVAFIRADLKDKVTDILDNGRDKTIPLAPSKYNAYFGLYSSAIKEVTKPRFCVIKDYNETQPVDVDFINETDRNSDDIIEQKTIDIEFNRFDGSGLISPRMCQIWGIDLGEDYTPCQFCIRTSFTKGMLNEYDFVDWCKEENDGNYFIRDIWDNLIDLREIDVILSEGQVKLWNCWDSQEHFEDCCQKNGIVWGVTKYAPKEDKKYSTANYQFLQTLDLSSEQVEELCKNTIDYIQGVSYDNIYYSLLFMLGENVDFGGVKAFMNCSDNYWLKTLILNHNLFNDKYSKEKIRDMIVKRIEQSCLGKILIEGNFQCIIPDPYAYMEWIVGKKVKGLLKAGEAYCEFWNNKGATQVDSLRSPLTHFSEHGINQLNNSEKARKWYQYSYSGYIINVHDEFTMVHAGSDFDFDIIFSTNNKQFLDGCRKNQRVVTYAPKKPKKKLFTEEDLYVTDTFSFGTKIGPITNICSGFVGMLPLFSEGSREKQLLEDRIKMCCGSQSRQIDKTKIGEDVKDIPSIWRQRQHIDPNDTLEAKAQKDFYNRLLAERKPYFFKYKYEYLNKEYRDFVKRAQLNAVTFFKKELNDMLTADLNDLTNEEKNFVEYYDRFLPVLETDCTMNKICKYIENQDFNIKQKVRNSEGFDYKLLQSVNPSYNKTTYNSVKAVVEEHLDKWHITTTTNTMQKITKNPQYESFIHEKEARINLLREDLEQVCSNVKQLTDMLIYLYYEEKKSFSKTTLWNLVGKQIFENVKEKTKSFYFPVKNQNGSLTFLFENYSIERFLLEDIFTEVTLIADDISNNMYHNKTNNNDNEVDFND